MTGSIRGRLISPAFARTVLQTLAGATLASPETDRQMERLGVVADLAVGPASSPRAIADSVALPLCRALGLRVHRRRDTPDEVRLDLGGSGPALVPALVRAWGDDLDLAWRTVVRAGIAADARWCLLFNGRIARFVDTQRTWSPRYLEFDLPALSHDADVRRIAWILGNAEALTRVPALLDAATSRSDEDGTGVCRALGAGVVASLASLFDALRPGSPQGLDGSRLLEQCLTVVYRVLFLLFAEARGLVPVWHPLYRDQYTIGSLVSAAIEARPSRGVWRAVQAISRMVHSGCSAGTLSVTAFNGRLFSPAQTAGIERRRIDDRVMHRVVLGLGTVATPGTGIARTRYDELDVEQLGSVYEHVLEYQPDPRQDSALIRTREARKASGTFYTPREIAALLVRRTLEPVTAGATAEQILRLRVLDPAMGSGAFLVAACRYLSQRAEAALVAEGTWHPGDVTDHDRIALRREIVQRCLYGVDLTPIAVQLARLSLWLLALARDKPLSFLDHHLIVGNSLVGASPSDITRSTASVRRTRPHRATLPLFDDGALETTLDRARLVREALAREPDDTVGDVRSKEQRLALLSKSDTSLGAWKRALDLWCATWFWDHGAAPDRATVADVTSGLLTGRSALGPRVTGPILDRSDACADRERFLHWTLAFPEVFHPRDGTAGGFDAVVGNPPWDMIRGDGGDETARDSKRRAARRLIGFVRNSGIYVHDGTAHTNRYALFVERALQLVRHAGRIGLVLPAGVLTDSGAAQLRRRLLARAAIEDVTGLDNRNAIFPIHRSMKFVILSGTAGLETQTIRCRFNVSRLDDLEALTPASSPIVVTRALLERVSGRDDLGLPRIGSSTDLRILEAITARVPTLGDRAGWHVRFGRELNASDDRALMRPARDGAAGRPVVEGKVMTPFRVSLKDCRLHLVPTATLRRSIPRHARLAYREIAGPGNRLTLIAALVPAGAVTTHTVFCLKSPLPLDAQHVLCALLNSLVSNYLVRMRVGTHVTAAVMSRLPVPVVTPESPTFARLLVLSRTLSRESGDIEGRREFAELQGLAARLYGVVADDFAHVLGTFPLIPQSTRDACFRALATDPHPKMGSGAI